MRRLLSLLLVLWTGCGDDQIGDDLSDSGRDAEVADVGADAGMIDGGPEDAGADAGVTPCRLEGSGRADSPAALTGRVDVVDYDVWDESQGRVRVRNAGLNFRTLTLPVRPLSDGALFVSVPSDTCVAFDLPAFTTNTGPARNIGTSLEISDELGTTIRLNRTSGTGGVEYDFASQADLLSFFDPDVLRFDRTWTYSSPGDAVSGIRPAQATIAGFSDFEIQPALTSTGAAIPLDASGAEFIWTVPTTAGELSIVLARALDPDGSARYLVCRPIDDGAFMIGSADLASFGASPGVAFDLAVSRGAVAPFCNEGVIAGAITHTLVYSGLGVLP